MIDVFVIDELNSIYSNYKLISLNEKEAMKLMDQVFYQLTFN